MASKPAHRLTLRDRLSQLSFLQAVKFLGPDGKRLLHYGGAMDVNVAEDVLFSADMLRVRFPSEGATATISLKADAPQKLHLRCSHCDTACHHVAALLSMVLDSKTHLGLAEPPPEAEANGRPLSDRELTERAIAEREERAIEERMKITPEDKERPWTDYEVVSLVSGKTYRVALRGLGSGTSYCTCPDFRTNTLGTCKHILKVERAVRKKFAPRDLKKPYSRKRIAVRLMYGKEIELRVELPKKISTENERLLRPFIDQPIDDPAKLLYALSRLERGTPYHIYPDAEEFMQQRLHRARLRRTVDEIRRDPAAHPLRESLLKIPLLPYQLDGVAFAAGAGRAILADDMGLGKTIQGVGVAEFLARNGDVRKVLIVCPASLKSQWRNEIDRFCDRDVQLITGRGAERAEQYRSDRFFTICNYEQVLKDITAIETARWDLIILDEGQRIKNWEAKTSRVVKGLKSRFALVLSGTPLENRLDELYSVVQFIDDRRLGPGFRFFHEHRITDERGKVAGYRKLDELRERLKPILLRRTRDSVRLELPPRTIEYVRIPPTPEQQALHDGHLQTVAKIVSKRYFTEMDLLRLRAALLMCRMSADSTFLCDKLTPAFSTKLDRIGELLDGLAEPTAGKVILFSEWTTMLDLIEPLLEARGLTFVRLDGSVPQQKRQELVATFQNDPACRFFLSSNAGNTGLNLQAASTVINVDLPWNPAVLEQRIARAHRMGQTNPVHVYVLVTENTLEERLLGAIAAKKELALAALDAESEVTEVELLSGSEQLKQRLEVLLGAKAEVEIEPLPTVAAAETAGEKTPNRERVAAAGGELLGAVFKFVGELVTADGPSVQPAAHVVDALRSRLQESATIDAAGRPQLTFTLPDQAALDGLAHTLARLLSVGQPAGTTDAGG